MIDCHKDVLNILRNQPIEECKTEESITDKSLRWIFLYAPNRLREHQGESSILSRAPKQKQTYAKKERQGL